MKKYFKLVLLVAFLIGGNVYSWAQTPSTEGQDFWVTFLQAQKDPTELMLTISAKEACTITVENPNKEFTTTFDVEAGSSTTISNAVERGGKRLSLADCYSTSNETATYTALHVTATKDISLFAGNYIDKTFDAADILPTPVLLDDYLIQTYPPSDHDGDGSSRGSHFAIVAVEDGETIVDYNLTTKTAGGKTGTQSATLKKGQVWYVWTGKGAGDVADLSGTTVKARNGKKIAVFQGCPHTNIPYMVEDRDHIFSQAMPTAYWGTEFGITASRHHRRDIIAVMAINDGTEVYINSEDGEPQLVHTFDFNVDKKHYWTFEIGEYLALSASNKSSVYPAGTQLAEPLVADSSCYLTTSCPAGVHLFMVSNRYDTEDGTNYSISDPAMLWISPIEQVIKEINFATYDKGTKLHYLNITTLTSNVKEMVLTDKNNTLINIAPNFYPIYGNSDYSFARIEIPAGNYNLKGKTGFLAHVYGYGERESYAYSCGSSTVQRSIAFNDEPLDIGGISQTHFCLGDTINMKLNIGNNDYESVLWDFGDGITYSSRPGASNNEKKTAQHAYSTPGWYDLFVTAKYVNACTGAEHTEDLSLSFCVVRADTVWHIKDTCVAEDYQGAETTMDTIDYACDSVVVTQNFVHRASSYRFSASPKNDTIINGVYYGETPAEPITWTLYGGNYVGCDSTIICDLKIRKCLNLEISNDSAVQFACYGDTYDLPFSIHKDADYGEVYFTLEGQRAVVLDPDAIKILETQDGRKSGIITLPLSTLQPGRYKATVEIEDVNCEDKVASPVLDIAVRYPEDVFNFKFNNVLAVYKPGHEGNAGWDFRAYQWYRNGEAIQDATESIYHTEEIFTSGDIYYVELTDKNGVTLPSCEFTVPDNLDNYEPETSEPAAIKTFINRRLYIKKGDVLYDMYGQRVK